MQSCQSLVLKWKAFLLIWKLLTVFQNHLYFSLFMNYGLFWSISVFHYLFSFVGFLDFHIFVCMVDLTPPCLPPIFIIVPLVAVFCIPPPPACLPAHLPQTCMVGILFFISSSFFFINMCLLYMHAFNSTSCVLYILQACLHSIQLAKCVHLIIMNIFIHKKGIIFSIFIQY